MTLDVTTHPSLHQRCIAPLLTRLLSRPQFNVALIVMFNYFYTFQQLDPKDLADQLKRQGASISGIRPGRNTADFITKTLNRMSILGSGFLGLLAAAPAGVEAITKLQVATPPVCSLGLNWRHVSYFCHGNGAFPELLCHGNGAFPDLLILRLLCASSP